jgi:hypothetical protein
LGPDRSLENSERGKNDTPTLEDTIACLDRVLEGAGLLELVVSNPAETGPRGLQVRSDDGLSIITLAEVDEKGEKNVRIFRSGNEKEEAEILGDKWNGRFVCRDGDIARKAVSELFSTGEVPKELIS